MEYVNLNSSRSDQTTMHLALSFSESTPAYEPGDVLAVLGVNGIEVPSRLLPIASSRREVRDEVHALMPVSGTDADLAGSIQVGSPLTVRVQRDAEFLLSIAPASDVIMVGTEAGVAPCRAFRHLCDRLGA